MSYITSLSVQQLRQAAELKEKIQSLEKALAQLLGTTDKTVAAPAKAAKKKFTMSAAGRARISAAAKARWAKVKAKTPKSAAAAVAAPAKAAKKKFTMSAAARAKISAAAKARWAKVKAEKKTA